MDLSLVRDTLFLFYADCSTNLTKACFSAGLTKSPQRQNETKISRQSALISASLVCVKFIGKVNHGLGEVKSPLQGDKSNFLLCADLVRVGNFCRNACASQNMDGVLGLHIVGRTVSFYVMVSPSTHYVMYQLAKIKISNCMDDLTKLVVDMHHALRALDVFHRICIRPTNSSLPSQYQMTTATSNRDHITSASQNHKRVCHLKHCHNQ